VCDSKHKHVTLLYLCDVEALDKLLPDVGAQAVADSQTHAVLGVGGRGLGGTQVAAQLSDVLDHRHVVFRALRKERRRRELLAQDQRASWGGGIMHHGSFRYRLKVRHPSVRLVRFEENYK
jgi:hypothetical protein